MKDIPRELFEKASAARPTALQRLDWCIEQLRSDATRSMEEDACQGLTFRELCSTLLAARQALLDKDEQLGLR